MNLSMLVEDLSLLLKRNPEYRDYPVYVEANGEIVLVSQSIYMGVKKISYELSDVGGCPNEVFTQYENEKMVDCIVL